MPEARWLSLTRLGPRHIPVVGPTEALHGRPDRPGMAVQPGAVPSAVPRPLAHPRKSGWQLAHQVWQDAGVDWEAGTTTYQSDPYQLNRYEPGPDEHGLSALYEQNLPEPTAYGPEPYEPGPYEPDPDEPDPDEPELYEPGLGAVLTGTQPDHIVPDDETADARSVADGILVGASQDFLFPDDAAVADQPPTGETPADTHATSSDLPVLQDPVDSRFGIGPWPVQQPAAVTQPQPVLADVRADQGGPAEHLEPEDRRQSESWPPAPRPSAPAQRPPVPAPRPPAPAQRPPAPAQRPPAPAPRPPAPAPRTPAPALRFAATEQRLPAAAPRTEAPPSGTRTPPRGLTPPRDLAPRRDFTPPREFTSQREFTSPRDFTPPRDFPPPRDYTPPRAFAPRSTPPLPSSFATPGAFGAPPAYASPRLSAPLGAPVDAPPLNTAPPLNMAPPLGESDELFRAWQGSVRQATERRAAWPAPRPASAAVRRRSWQVARIGVPAAVIVTVGAGALMMLTGRANEMLAQRASTGPLSSAAPGASASLAVAGLGAGTTLTGYPGEHGAAEVTALWSAGDTLLAVGYANGHPAVWRHTAGGAWSLVSATVFGGLTGHLTSVAHGPAGWITVGSAIENGSPEPVAFWSPDGVTWSPLLALTALARTDAQFLGVASGPGGYVVVGRQGTGASAYASFWSSANLLQWGSDNSGNAGTVASAAVAVGNGFVAVGAAANCHSIWTSPDGRQWTEHDLAKPSGATAATLQSVAAGAGGRFVAAGFATAGAVNVPLVVTSVRAGAPLTQVVLGANGAPATVTGVTTTSGGFLAVGLAGPAGERHAVEWTSPDGLIWSAAAPLASAGSSEITALTTSGAVAAGTAQRSAGPTVLTIPGR